MISGWLHEPAVRHEGALWYRCFANGCVAAEVCEQDGGWVGRDKVVRALDEAKAAEDARIAQAMNRRTAKRFAMLALSGASLDPARAMRRRCGPMSPFRESRSYLTTGSQRLRLAWIRLEFGE